MNITTLAPNGTFPKINFYNGNEYIVAQVEDKAHKDLVIWENRQEIARFLLPQGQSFPDISDSGWVVWREGDHTICSAHLSDLKNIRRSAGLELFGNEMIFASDNYVFYQTRAGVARSNYTFTENVVISTKYLPTGIYYVDEITNEVDYIDDVRFQLSPSGIQYTRPYYTEYADDRVAIVCEGQDDKGLVAWLENSTKEIKIASDLLLFTPAAVSTPTGLSIVAWGEKLVLIDVSFDEFKIPKEESPKMKMPGITIDSYDRKLSSKDNWKLKWHDRNNSGFSGTVEFKNGSVHIGFTNPEGSDYSGAKRLVTIVAESPGESPSPFEIPPVTGPTDWRGNFLALPGFEYAFMYPAWNKAKRDQFRQTYKTLGLTHLPLSPWAKYRDEEYDFAQDPEGFREIIQELQQDGIYVCVMAYTDGFDSFHPKSLTATKQWAEWYFPHLNESGDVKLVCSGWEFNQINGSEWTGDGKNHIEWLKFLRNLFPSTPLYAHFSPERTSGWPNYPNHDGPQDEASWWKELGNTITGILYQRPPDEDIEELLNHTIGGGGDVGDVNRIAGSYWNLQQFKFHFVVFEHSREYSRWQKIVNRVARHPLVNGYC